MINFNSHYYISFFTCYNIVFFNPLTTLLLQMSDIIILHSLTLLKYNGHANDDGWRFFYYMVAIVQIGA